MFEDTALIRRRRTRFLRSRTPRLDGSGTGNGASMVQHPVPTPSNDSTSSASVDTTNGNDSQDEEDDFSMYVLSSSPLERPAAEVRYSENSGNPVISDTGSRGWMPLQFEPGSIAPHWGVRCTKFMKTASGKDVLVFTEVSLCLSFPHLAPQIHF